MWIVEMCLSTKMASQLVSKLHDNELLVQNKALFFLSPTGGQVTKIMPETMMMMPILVSMTWMPIAGGFIFHLLMRNPLMKLPTLPPMANTSPM